jgi:hypothetical protein
MASSSAHSHSKNFDAATLEIVHWAGDINRCLVALLEVRPAQAGQLQTQWQNEFASEAVSKHFQSFELLACTNT